MKGDPEDPFVLYLTQWQVDLIEKDKGVDVQQAVDDFFRMAVTVKVI